LTLLTILIENDLNFSLLYYETVIHHTCYSDILISAVLLGYLNNLEITR